MNKESNMHIGPMYARYFASKREYAIHYNDFSTGNISVDMVEGVNLVLRP